ncbi:MAG: hypothetical protein RR258_06115, partial [Alistipes sp.]
VRRGGFRPFDKTKGQRKIYFVGSPENRQKSVARRKWTGKKDLLFLKRATGAGLQANRPRFFTENQTFSQTPQFSQCDFAMRT